MGSPMKHPRRLLAALGLTAAALVPLHAANDMIPLAFTPDTMDRTVDPRVDFNAYANGGWLKRTPIPPEVTFDTSLVGQGFSATVGRFGYKISPYLYQRPDATPYYSQEYWDNG